MFTPVDVVETAREYLGTKFQHQARVKSRAVDCAGLLICVGWELGAWPREFDVTNYPRIPNGNEMYLHLKSRMNEINCKDAEGGDVLLMKFDREPQHIALLTSKDYVIHSYAQIRRVTEHRMDEVWWSRVVAVFRFREFCALAA